MQILFLKEWAISLMVSAFLGIVIFFAFIPFFSGKILFEDDVTYYYLPSFKFYSDALKAGESFYINPYVFSGFPQYLSQVGGFYEPINYVIFKFLPFPLSYHLRIFLNYWLAAIFMFLFGRAAGFGLVGSLVAAFSYITAQQLVPGMNILRSNSFFLAPVLFYVILRLHQLSIAGSPTSPMKSDFLKLRLVFYILLGAAIFAVSMLGGYTQLNVYVLVGAGFFTLYFLLRRFSLKFLFSTALMVVLGVLLVLPWLSRIADLIPLTFRSGGISFGSAKMGAGIIPVIFNLTVNLILPPFHFGTLQSLYIGALGFLSVLAAFIWGSWSRLWFWVSLLLFSVVSSFPYPLFWLMFQIPPFNFFRFPIHWLFLGSFALSILAGMGYKLISENAAGGVLKQVRVSLDRRSAKILVAAILALNFLIPAWITASYVSVDGESIFKTPWVVEKIREREKDTKYFRTYDLYSAEQTYHGITKNLLAAGAGSSVARDADINREVTQTSITPSIWGVPAIQGFDNFVPKRYSRMLSIIEATPWADLLSPGVYYGQLEELQVNLHPAIFDILGMMNVKYIWTIVRFPNEYLGKYVISVATDYERLSPLMSAHPLPIPLHLYENKKFLPRVFSPPEVMFFREGEDHFSEIAEAGNDFGKIGFIECNSCPAGKISQTPAEVSIANIRNDSVIFASQSAEPAWVIVSNAFIPGWRAFIDGEETPIYYANYIYQGIKIPAGEHIIEFRYIGVISEISEKWKAVAAQLYFIGRKR